MKLSTIIKIIIFALCAVLFFTTVCLRKTLAQASAISAGNEFMNTSSPVGPQPLKPAEPPFPEQPPVLTEEPRPAQQQKPAGTTGQTYMPKPAETANSLVDPPAVLSDDSCASQMQTGPFDPANTPKTGDNTNIKLLLTGLVTGFYMLRQAIYSHKQRPESKGE